MKDLNTISDSYQLLESTSAPGTTSESTLAPVATPESLASVTALHRSLVEIPSLSREEGPIADFLEALFQQQNNLKTERIGNNLFVTLGQGPNTLLMNTHLDVVPPSSNHPFDPFKAVQKDGLVFGRGSVDAKASVAAMSMTMLSLARENYEPDGGRLMLALTVCEELGGNDNGLETILPELPPPNSAIVGEPTEMKPCIAQKGLLILRVISNGKTAHAARSHLGVNAIEKSADDLIRLKQLKFDRIHPFLGETTLTPTMINGGSAKNVVPDCCTITLDIRTTPVYKHRELVELLRQKVSSEIEIHSDRLIPVDTSPGELIVQACQKASLLADPDSKPFGSPTLSDWIYLQGIPTVKMGPGDSQLSHRPDEHVSIQQLERGLEVYRNAIHLYFQ